ncbi:MAG: WbqC family protein [Calditrichia bacterium]
MTLIAAQQPYYLPDFHYFSKIYQSDVFLLADHLRFRKQSPMVRAVLNKEDSGNYLTIPVVHQPEAQPPLHEIQMLDSNDWHRRHLKTIASQFHQFPYFDFFFPELEAIYKEKDLSLSSFLIKIIRWHTNLFFREKRIIVASEIGIHDMYGLKKWFAQFPERQWLIFAKEREYYRKNFPAVSLRNLDKNARKKFPPEYHPNLPFLVLIFLKGPESILYFKSS